MSKEIELKSPPLLSIWLCGADND